MRRTCLSSILHNGSDAKFQHRPTSTRWSPNSADPLTVNSTNPTILYYTCAWKWKLSHSGPCLWTSSLVSFSRDPTVNCFNSRKALATPKLYYHTCYIIEPRWRCRSISQCSLANVPWFTTLPLTYSTRCTNRRASFSFPSLLMHKLNRV